jgi:hypothetical protein
MSGGGGGSVLAMIQMLRNNKNLLNKRTSYFKIKRNYTSAKKSGTTPLTSLENRKPISREELQAIRKKIKSGKRKNLLLISLLSGFCLFLVVLGFQSVLSRTSTHPIYKSQIETVVYSKLKPQPFRDHMKSGLMKLEDKDYFMAAGSFKRALKHKPGNLMAEYYLTKSYCLLCYQRNQACAEAKAMVLANKRLFPRDYKFQYLDKTYLK